jgi:uncharacterized phage infection (PIP) family protein YhgE
MNPGEILSFLLPQFGDRLQLTFFTIILLMVGYTVIGVHLKARAASWEHEWNRGTPDDPTDDLDIEHGSVTDLWHAVATGPEKLAEIMPGMLLVVGLLGTFLGLGLALNHASNILGQSNLQNPGAAADSMQNLLDMLQGLGTKFKTSTWGILCFVLLKIWSEVTRFEEKRLAWVIGKTKSELETRKREQLTRDADKQHALFEKIGSAADHIVNGLSTHLKGLEKNTQGVRTDLGQVYSETKAMREAMGEFTKSTQAVVDNMGDAARRMADGADMIGSGSTKLVSAVGEFEKQFTEVLDNVRKDLGKAINDMSAQASTTLERGSAQLTAATSKIEVALGELSKDVKGTMNEVKSSINRALEIQETATERFIESSEALNENLEITKGIAEKLTAPIEEGLESISESNLKMRKVADASVKLADSLKDVVDSLKGLPDALSPLTKIPDEQKKLISSLKPLEDSVGVQQAILQSLQALDKKLKPRLPATPSTEVTSV